MLVGGETLVDHLTLKPSRLGGSVGVSIPAVDEGIGVVLQRRRQVANGGEPQTGERWILGFVGNLVGQAGTEPALQRHPVRIERQFAILYAAKLPVLPRNQARSGGQAFTFG